MSMNFELTNICVAGLCEDSFSDKPGKLPTKVLLEVDLLVSPVVHTPRKIPMLFLNQHRRRSQRWKKMRLFSKKGNTLLEFHVRVTDKLKVEEKSTPPL